MDKYIPKHVRSGTGPTIKSLGIGKGKLAPVSDNIAEPDSKILALPEPPVSKIEEKKPFDHNKALLDSVPQIVKPEYVEPESIEEIPRSLQTQPNNIVAPKKSLGILFKASVRV